MRTRELMSEQHRRRIQICCRYGLGEILRYRESK